MSKTLDDLNPQQKEAVTTTEGPLLIIAGAGTGKTTVIAKRIAYIIEKKLAKPSEILALTFTDKAAAEMENRVDVLVPYGFVDTWISTFHAFGDRILRENALDIGLAPDFKVLSRPQQVLFFQQNLFRISLDYYRPLSNPNKFISAMLSFFSRLKDENVTVEEFNKYVSSIKYQVSSDEEIEAQKYQELASAYESYEKFKAEAGVLDFGDQVVKAIDLFIKRPKILKDYQNQFKYILVDEYQDTNYAQNEMVKTLAAKSQNICVVGDDDQSIYKFRGAAISNIMEFEKTYKKAKQVVLTQNYRSTQAILDSAYKLIRNNDPDRLEVQNKINKKLTSRGGQGLPPQEIFADTISEEADAVAAEIEKLIGKSARNKRQSAVSRKQYAYKDFAILVRANSQADHFLRALNMKGIPHKFVGSSGLYQQEEVSTIISFLNAICDFEDSLNIYSLLTSDVYELSPIDAIKLTSYAKKKNRSLFYVLKNLDSIDAEDIKISEESRAIVDKMMEDLNYEIELSRKENAGRITYDFLKRTSYLQKLERKSGIEGQLKIQNIAKFFDKIKEFEDIAKVETVGQFVDYLETLRDAGDDPATVEFDPDLDAVNVMTAHGAKGLEFSVVFLVNLVSDRFPTRARSEAIEMPQELIKESLPIGDWHLQEERRLFYVGITRAKDLLFLSWSRDVGGARIKKISPFILEALDKPKSNMVLTKLSPKEKIEKFAPIPPRTTQTLLFDVDTLKLTQGSIDDYLTCAYKYRYIHVLKVPILKHHAIVYGSALHLAVAQFWQNKKKGKILTLPQLLEVFENSWDSEGFLTIEHEEKRKNKGKLALENFHKRESKSPDVPTLIESGFKFTVGDVTVVGRYDRVDIKPGSKVSIIDYKSSENITQERANAQAKDSTQLAIYALSYYKQFKIIPQYVGLHFLENGIEGGYAPDMKDIQKAEKLIADTADKISRDAKNNSFVANPKYFGREPACNYCAYNSICPFSLAKI
ncbi:MAG TPA: UvrD-helicase domain-containing protein [Candidatus Saccharimonadales bacterium]|nr:UvrD-helicase domain-containing protein [Candidatus Saccharimonadales bacterium]